MLMEFQWDEAKRKLNLHNHGIDFAGIEQVFAGETVTMLDDASSTAKNALSRSACLRVA
jgi:uncharacterized DUF497 family protein